VILFNASTWRGHRANTSLASRRSPQGTFIPRSGRPATDFAARMQPETLARLGALARYVIGIDTGVATPA
jgi:ectoine hydroxylase-related dioxygenase (phytanoyl-CoA dioxygenase family)